MTMMVNACDMPLGLNFLEILLHLFNLAILIVGIRFLIYKPVKKFIEKRKADYKAEEDAANKTRDDAEALKAQYEQALGEAKDEAARISEEAVAGAKVRAEDIVNGAKEEAKLLLDKTNADIAQSKELAKEQMAAAVPELAVNMASKILEREVKSSDNEAVIDSVLEEWNKK